MLFIDEEIYKQHFQQKPYDILTPENLDKLEKHCKKAIHYEKGNLKEEHEIILQLIYHYENSVSKDKIKDKIEESYNRKFSNFTNECNFAVEKVLKELLESEK